MDTTDDITPRYRRGSRSRRTVMAHFDGGDPLGKLAGAFISPELAEAAANALNATGRRPSIDDVTVTSTVAAGRGRFRPGYRTGMDVFGHLSPDDPDGELVGFLFTPELAARACLGLNAAPLADDPGILAAASAITRTVLAELPDAPPSEVAEAVARNVLGLVDRHQRGMAAVVDGGGLETGS